MKKEEATKLGEHLDLRVKWRRWLNKMAILLKSGTGIKQGSKNGTEKS